MSIQISYDSKTIDLQVGDLGLQTNFKHSKDQRQSSNGKTETISRHGIMYGAFDAIFSESTYYDLLGWWSWARQGKAWAFARDSALTADATFSASAASGQKNVSLSSTSGLSVGDIVYLRAEDADDEYEVAEIAAISMGGNDSNTLALVRASDDGECIFSDYGLGDNSPHILTKYQTPTCETDVTKFNTRSIKFDGTAGVNVGDGLILASSPDWVSGSSSYTMDAQIYITGWTGQAQTVVARRNGGVTWPTVHLLIQDTTGYLIAAIGNDACDDQFLSIANTRPIGLNTWHHVAMVVNRDVDRIRLYRDGIETGYSQQGSGMTPVGNCNVNKAMNIGFSIIQDAQHDFFKGYMDEIRISDVIREDLGASAAYGTFSGITIVDDLKYSYNSGDTFRHLEYFPSVLSLDDHFNPIRKNDIYEWNFRFAEEI